MKKIYSLVIASALIGFYFFRSTHEIGDEIDNFNGVAVYYNGNTSNVSSRGVTADGYNLGLKYQCVEFVKRYYYQHLNHKMPNSYGNAVDFYNKNLSDGAFNIDRGLFQFSNPSTSKPKVNDLIILDGHLTNPYGHVAIVSAVEENELEIIQQNGGKRAKTRVKMELTESNGAFLVENKRVLGWLRLKK